MKVAMLKKAMVPVLRGALSFADAVLCGKCCKRDACKVLGGPEKRGQLFLWKQRTFV